MWKRLWKKWTIDKPAAFEGSALVRKRPPRRASDEDDEGVFVYGVAWA